MSKKNIHPTSFRQQRSTWLLTILFVLFLAQWSPTVFGQQEEAEEEIVEEEQAENVEVSLTQLLAGLASSTGDVIVANRTFVIGEEDGELMEDIVFYKEYRLNSPDNKGHRVYFYDCNFRLGPSNPLSFYGWKFAKLNFVGCTFDMPFALLECSTSTNYPIVFENCVFNNDLKIEHSFDRVAAVNIMNNQFHKRLIINAPIELLTINHCDFTADSLLFGKLDEEQTHYQLEAANIEVGTCKIDWCTFHSPNQKRVYSIDFQGSEFDKLTMFSNQLASINFTDAGVEKALMIDSLNVHNYIGIQNFDFPEANTNIPWDNLKGQKLALFQTELSQVVIPYQAKSEKQLGQTLLYNDLISTYKKFNKLYTERGDIQSANGSYVEIKQIETARQEYIQKVNPSMSNYINLLLNRVLSYFSDYATNPGKSVRRALEWLLIFTVLYMLTFSEWDGMNYRYYVRQYKLFSAYLSEPGDITDFYQPNDMPEEELLEGLSRDYLKKQKRVPKLVVLFGEPLYYMGKMRRVMMPRLIRFFNFQKEDWASLNTKKRIWSGFIIGLVLLSFVIYVLLVKFFNGLIMSLNSFVVIGFGALPEKGLAMYICIIEGIIGWFLLTIFTITLFSQVLQGGA